MVLLKLVGSRAGYSCPIIKIYKHFVHHSRAKGQSHSQRFCQGRYFHSSKLCLAKSERVVFISTSDIIYENLALEEWIYEKKDLCSTEFLFMWKNRPAIVSGRHQNPWLEANVPLATSLGLDIARRSSGGGTVYHDEGNLNLSFLKSRESYNRRENLNLVVNAITSQWDIDLTVNDRDDILLNKLYKVSGTAAKLGRLQSYHHFTLLHSVDQDLLQRCLQSPMQGARSRASKSFPSTVMNLSDLEAGINFESLVRVIGKTFLDEVGLKVTPETFRYVNPLHEEDFHGVADITNRLQTWDWRYGKTPDFTIERNFSGQNFKSKLYCVEIEMTIKKGVLLLLKVNLDLPELMQLNTILNEFCCENSNFTLTQDNLTMFKDRFFTSFSESNCKGHEHASVAKWVLKCIESCLNFL